MSDALLRVKSTFLDFVCQINYRCEKNDGMVSIRNVITFLKIKNAL